MNTLEISRVAKSHPKLKKYFQGVYALDQIPYFIPRYPAAYIINTHPMKKPGDHWVALYFDSRYNGTYFDSFGFPPRHKRIITFLKRNSSTWTYSNTPLQYPFSLLCGEYCIYFLVQKSQGISLNKFLSFFNYDLELNDKKITRYAARNFT
jgi:hypothetical protein